MTKRNLLYLTLSEIEPRVWFMLTGCNFRCKGCFRPARDGGGTPLTASETLELMDEASLNYYRTIPSKALITGGEPTLDKDYLLKLVSGLHERAFSELVLMTNGYALGMDEEYVAELEVAGLTEAHVDIKAFSDAIHQSYTGKSNGPVLRAIEQLNDSEIAVLVQTVYLPGLVEADEIEKIAQFLASVNPNIRYRINPFVPVFAYEQVTRRPTLDELEHAYEIASHYLPNAIISRSCYREYPTPPPQKTWITVYPDLSMRRRGMKEQAEDRVAWLGGVRSRERVLQDWQREQWDFDLRHRLVSISESSLQPTRHEREKEEGSVKVRFPQALHRLIGTRITELDVSGAATVETVLQSLVDTYGVKFKEMVLVRDGATGNLKFKRSFNLYLNGMNIKNLQGIQTQIKGGDELIILSWVSGG